MKNILKAVALTGLLGVTAIATPMDDAKAWCPFSSGYSNPWNNRGTGLGPYPGNFFPGRGYNQFYGNPYGYAPYGYPAPYAPYGYRAPAPYGTPYTAPAPYPRPMMPARPAPQAQKSRTQ